MKHLTCKITVLLHKVHLQVKFPCSLSAFLKIQSQQVQIGQQAPLRLGEAILEMSVSHNFQLLFDPQRKIFEEKKISVLLFLKSGSGRIPAGSTLLSLNSFKKGNNNRLKLNIEKCPDKQAYIEVTVAFEGINQLLFSNVQSRVKSELNDVQNGHRLSFGSHGKQGSTPSLVEETKSYRNYRQNGNESSLKNSKEFQNKQNEALNYNIKRSATSRGEDSRQHQSPTHSPDHHLQYNVRSKTHELQRELKNLQKRFEQQASQLKSTQTKKQIAERTLKENEGHLKIALEKYEDIHVQYQGLTKKSQYKENALRQQIKYLTEKLSASQSEKQKLIFQKNDIVNDFEERQKTLRFNLRQKQKVTSDDKLRISKKLQQVTTQNNQFKIGTLQLQERVNELQKQLKAQKSKFSQLENVKTQLELQITELKSVITQEKNHRMQLQDALGSNLQLQEQKKKFKKKVNQLQQEIAKQMKSVSASQASNQRNQRRCQQLQSSIKQLTNSLKSSQKENQRLLKQVQTLKALLKQQKTKMQDFEATKSKECQKLAENIKQLQIVQKRLQEEQRGTTREVKQRESIINSLREQIKNNEFQITTARKHNLQLQEYLSSQKNQLEKLRYEYQQTLNSKASLESEILELEAQLKSFKQQLELKEVQNRNQARERQEERAKFESQIKNLQYKLSNSNQELSFKIEDLSRKVLELTTEVDLKSQELDNLQKQFESLQSEKGNILIDYQELQQALKMKSKELQFSKQSLSKANQDISASIKQNKELNLHIQSLNKIIKQLQAEIEAKKLQIEEANSNQTGLNEQFQKYKQANIQNLTLFLKSIGQGSISLSPKHQEQQITELIRQAIGSNNRYVSGKEESIKNLQSQIHQMQRVVGDLKGQVEDKINEINFLSDSLNEQQVKNSDLNKSSEVLTKQLKDEIKSLKASSQSLKRELQKLQILQTNTANQLQNTTRKWNQQVKKSNNLANSLKSKQEAIEKQKQDFLKSSTSQSNKLTNQIQKLQQKIKQLEANLKEKNTKCTQLGSQIATLNKDQKEIIAKYNTQTKALSGQISELTSDLEKRKKQNQVKTATITKYAQTQSQLKSSLAQANKQISALKELNQNIRKRNEKGTLKQKQLQEEISALKQTYNNLVKKENGQQKQLKENSIELTTLRESNFKLQNQNKKLITQLDISKATIKIKEDIISKNQITLKSLQTQLTSLKTNASANEKGFSEKEGSFKKQIKQLEVQLESERKESMNEISRLNKFSSQITQIKLQLEEKLIKLTKAIENKEKSNQIQTQYLKPIKQSLNYLKGYMNQYSRVGDNFQSSKNKLLKVAATKTQQYTDKNIADKVREISLAFQKLKAYILGQAQINEELKLSMSQEMKKVQLSLDRVLRGQR